MNLFKFIPFKHKPESKPEIISPPEILVVDDEELILSLFTACLSEYRVATAPDAKAGWVILSQHKETIKLVISDYNMPGTNGIQFLRQVAGAYPGMRRILCSGSLTEADLFLYNEAYHEGIIKPFNLDDVDDLVRRIISDDYVPKTSYTKELREVVSRLTESPPPEIQQAFLKIASMTFNV